MSNKLDLRRIIIFIIIAFGLAWLAAVAVYLTGGIVNSPELIPGTYITLATVLIAVVYMWAPALANIFTRVITREGWKDTWLRPNLKKSWKYWLASWLLPPVLIVTGTAIFFVLLPKYFDPEFSVIKSMLPNQGEGLPIPLFTIILLQLVQGIIIAPFINSIFTFGEEFGWRGYLLQKLMPLGTHKAVPLLGVIWGIWHAPVIAMGHNYGFDYPLFPWAGILAMIWFTILIGIFLVWVTIRAHSVWPAVIGHAVINGLAGISVLMSKGEPSTLIGPLSTGLLGGIGWLVAAILIYFSKSALSDKPEAGNNLSMENTGGTE